MVRHDEKTLISCVSISAPGLLCGNHPPRGGLDAGTTARIERLNLNLGRFRPGAEEERNMRRSVILALGAGLGLATALPAAALDVSASVGGVSAGVSAGGGSGVSADVSAGGGSGVNASASVGGGSPGGGLGANANASVGGTRGVNADVNARIGAETALGVSVGVGGTGANPGGPGTGPSPVPVSEYFASRDTVEQARMKRTCRAVLSDQQAYEKDLADLCRIISRL
jgi:hypothetical protein